MDTPRTTADLCRRVAARTCLALAVGGVLVLGPSAALAQAPGVPTPSPVGTTHHSAEMDSHMCASMNVPWL